MKRYSRLERRHFPAIYLFLLPTLILFALFYVIPIPSACWRVRRKNMCAR